MNKMYEAEETILAMSDIVQENRALRERVQNLELQLGIEKSRFYGKKDLTDKLEKRYSENLSYNLIRSVGGLSSDTKGFIMDMDNLTNDEYEFLSHQVMR